MIQIGKRYKRKSNGNEIEVIVVEDGYVWFIERSVQTALRVELFFEVFE